MRMVCDMGIPRSARRLAGASNNGPRIAVEDGHFSSSSLMIGCPCVVVTLDWVSSCICLTRRSTAAETPDRPPVRSSFPTSHPRLMRRTYFRGRVRRGFIIAWAVALAAGMVILFAWPHRGGPTKVSLTRVDRAIVQHDVRRAVIDDDARTIEIERRNGTKVRAAYPTTLGRHVDPASSRLRRGSRGPARRPDVAARSVRRRPAAPGGHHGRLLHLQPADPLGRLVVRPWPRGGRRGARHPVLRHRRGRRGGGRAGRGR